ncbi:hypothetical protein [Brucella intermedia]|uniref:hypothetical protein n=1 Tax=Brucella intermedia TaxID=94625 RepID=UPI001591F7B6|nr:hypothetical protein [Brucella intermedia]
MASELNHHVGYSRENECWFVRFYPYQTEQQATEAISEFTHPTPVASVSPDATGKCGELVTVAWQYRIKIDGVYSGWYASEHHRSPSKAEEQRELVTRSQAEELLAEERAEKENEQYYITVLCSDIKELKADNAAKDAEISNLKAINANLMGDDEDKPRYTTKRLRHEIACATEALEADNAAMTARVKELRIDRAAWEAVATDIRKQAKALEAKLAEKDARIKELEAALDSDPDGSGLWRFWSKKSIEANQQLRDKTKTLQSLEAKLEAAEKALEFYADASKWADGYFKSEDDGTVLRAYPSSVDKDQGDKARAALGGKQ